MNVQHATTWPSVLRRRSLLALPWLAACAEPLRTPAESFPPEPVGVSEALGVASRLRVRAFRGGVAGHLGHNHVLLAGDFAGRLVWPDAETRQRRDWARATLVAGFSLAGLQVDPPEERAALGPAFASRLDEADRAGTRANLLRALEAEAYPEVRLQSTRSVGEGPLRAVELAIELHGRVRRQWLAVRVDEQGQAQGEAVLRQSDFGLTPFSILGGLLAVRDELLVDVSLSAAGP
jgi:hypothetical protein